MTPAVLAIASCRTFDPNQGDRTLGREDGDLRTSCGICRGYIWGAAHTEKIASPLC